jgi:hypothetical protein
LGRDFRELARLGGVLTSIYRARMTTDSDRRARAIAAFQAANAEDPTLVSDGAELRPKELVAAERLALWVERLAPQPSEALALASHCQHLCRWKIPRSAYPDGRIGYLTWRKALAKYHADQAAEILRGVGYGDDVLLAVRQINLKQGLHLDADVQTMEDALCLSFLEHELEAFSREHPEAKVIDIIAKSWRKMSDRGREVALTLPLSEHAGALVQQALQQPGPAPAMT